MSVVTNNTSTYPQLITGAMIQIQSVPNSILGSSPPPPSPQGNATPASQNTQPTQVIGLVPLFSCCISKDASGAFSFGSFDVTSCSGAVTTISITLHGTNIGNILYQYNTTNASLTTAINALLVAAGFAGWTSSVTGISTNRVCVLLPPSGSGATYNGWTIVAAKIGTGCGGVLNPGIPVQGGSGSGGAGCDPNCDCREGLYTADSIADDRQYTLPVFAEAGCSDSYHNDYNSWLIQYPGTYNAISNGDFKLQKLINGIWTNQATLNNNTYGTPYSNNFYTGGGTCQNVNYCGFLLQWQLVLAGLGEGTYRFYASGTYSGTQNTYCMYSPPFCLKTWDCTAVDGTCKWEASYSGGNIGSVTTQGASWSMCCSQTTKGAGGQTITTTVPISWIDSIRIFGFFGKETYEYQRDYIKYASGEIKKIRDENIKNFEFQSSQLPMWFHQRFASYGVFADKLFVSDYSLNNDVYSYKYFWVVADSNYQPSHKGYTRYPKVYNVKFKEGLDFVYRDRCC